MNNLDSGNSSQRPNAARLRISARGVVQGVGFRPFVFRLATEMGLAGWVSNTPQGAVIEVEGAPELLSRFVSRLEQERPPLCSLQSLEQTWLDPVSSEGFVIRPSADTGPRSALVLPDIATCPDCRREIFDSQDRRYFYPFTNCTRCGPRFSIIERLPYDRANTSMKGFAMCAQCQAEYDDPANRRFHAQPNACPVCGPQITLASAQGTALEDSRRSSSRAVLEKAAARLRNGEILALKGLGGFHLLTLANDPGAIERLRRRKHREEKPFAVMFPSLQSARDLCEVTPLEERLLRSPEAPIVLLQRRLDGGGAGMVHESAAPGNPLLGVLLPYTPLHHLLLSLVRQPLIATSGNLSDEPICTDNQDALVRLADIADVFLLHDRPILRHLDDSIARVILGRELVLRRARGYAPLPLRLSRPGRRILAVGAHLKNTVALSRGCEVFISQHIGDLETSQANEAFEQVIGDLQRLLEISPEKVAADLHPDYVSTRYARKLAGASLRPVMVQHHIAHVFSCMAENEQGPPLLGVSWDGTGHGLDGAVWGGEFFMVKDGECRRFAHLRPFRLPGGEAAIREPRRSALGVLFEALGPSLTERSDLPLLRAFDRAELRALVTMLSRGVNSPLTTSAGRLFDAVAALAGLRQRIRFEGQAAMDLEFAAQRCRTDESYLWTIRNHPGDGPLILDWAQAIEALLADQQQHIEVASARFHNSLTDVIIEVARRAGTEKVLLTGGCFQNAYLLERTVRRLRLEGFRPYWHQRVPPGDGGIALGQVAYAHWSEGG